jgi:hypothetical protein
MGQDAMRGVGSGRHDLIWNRRARTQGSVPVALSSDLTSEEADR